MSVAVDASLVRRLVEAQYPEWAGLPLTRVDSAGTDHWIFRLGRDMAVRLPRVEWALGQAEKEHRWLPTLAPLLPLAIPVPLAQGEPCEGYPWRWSVYRWLEGEIATSERLADPAQAARDLACFVAALARVDPAGGPAPGAHNVYRGLPLAVRDRRVRESIAALGDEIDQNAVTAEWEAALRAPIWRHPPVWIHGDIHPGNLLAARGRLSAVIDFGCLAVGDPACDLLPAWNLLNVQTREVFRSALGVDDATWARGRGWALSVALIALPYYRETNPAIVESSRRVIAELLAQRE